MRKNIGGKAANSALGKKAIKSQTPEESQKFDISNETYH